MEKTIQELKTIIRDLIVEVGELKERLAILEKERWEEDHQAETSLSDHNMIIELEGELFSNLGKIYLEGYHVCPLAYGQRRDGECLFCVAFMEKE